MDGVPPRTRRQGSAVTARTDIGSTGRRQARTPHRRANTASRVLAVPDVPREVAAIGFGQELVVADAIFHSDVEDAEAKLARGMAARRCR